MGRLKMLCELEISSLELFIDFRLGDDTIELLTLERFCDKQIER